jgi:hypothetical protein
MLGISNGVGTGRCLPPSSARAADLCPLRLRAQPNQEPSPTPRPKPRSRIPSSILAKLSPSNLKHKQTTAEGQPEQRAGTSGLY